MGNFGGYSLFPPVIKGLIIANAAVFFSQHFFLKFLSVGGDSLSDFFFYWMALFPIGEGSNFQIWQIISYQFLHGGFMHFFFNMFVLWMFGRELEEVWGGTKFLVFYLLSGIGAAVVQLLISPLFSSVAPTVGASGSVMGIMAAFALMDPNRSVLIFPIFIPVKIKFVVIFIIAGDLLMGLLSTNSMVAHFAHLGGAAAGYFLYKYGDDTGVYRFFSKLFGTKEPGHSDSFASFRNQNVYEDTSSNWGRPRNPFTNPFREKEAPPKQDAQPGSTINVNGEEITQAKIDEILDKISAAGYQSLTEREKKILFELSQKIK